MKGKGKGKGKKKEEEGSNDGSSGNEVGNTSDSSKSAPPPPSSLPPSASVSASASASVSASVSVGSSKRKYSALGDSESLLSGSGQSSGSKKRKESGFEQILQSISKSMRDFTDDRKSRMTLPQVHAQAQAQAAPNVRITASSPERRLEAREKVQREEQYLDPERMVALLDHISEDTAAADIYLSLHTEPVRKAWIDRRLKQMGFVEGVTVGM